MAVISYREALDAAVREVMVRDEVEPIAFPDEAQIVEARLGTLGRV